MAASETFDFTHYLPTSRARSSRHASKAASSSLAGGRAARSSRSKLRENSAGSVASRWRKALPGVRGVFGSSMMLLS